MSTDIEAEKRSNKYLEGFAEFSHYIGSDETLSVYRRFGTLAARNILYLQAELQFLEDELKRLDEQDRKDISKGSNMVEKNAIDAAARMWEAFSDQSDRGNERQSKKMRIILRIREVMRMYEKAILRRSQVQALNSPSTKTLLAFTNWFRSRVPFRASSFTLLDDEKDLMSLYTEENSDRLSTFIQQYFGYALRSRKDPVPESWQGMYYFPQTRVARLVAVLSVLISVLLLFGAILLLYFIPAQNMGRRLIAIGFFTTGFALSVGVLTNAKRVEIFAATAAYTAVLVVFLAAPTPD
ncbi:hypothetical protein HYFRA_00009034 [Hymenoscyphus fraxineus]|uniref:DUF6594 domain-containing protein n=1 Tax=Hymenoscyphus fraxineus TaxID=746836 RepID=A0A9N9PH94_9HELO|nr:hypothetical protein HYFRA_00009034 [Hymenoscyphus fraxineus]